MPAPLLLCLAIALHDVDGPIYCRGGTEIRLAGIGAIELDGRRRPGQPGVAGDGFEQRRTMAFVMGGGVGADDETPGGRLTFKRPVQLACEPVGRSYRRVVAWCRLPDRRDLSCAAILGDVARRWPAYDRGRRLVECESWR